MSRLGAAAVCLVLAACGFQLRGETAMGLKSLYVSTEVASHVANEIRRQLSSGSTKLAPSAPEAEAHLRILTEDFEKKIQTLTSAGRVFDFQLRLRVGFQVADAAGNLRVAPTEIEVRRLLSYSESAPLANEAEEKLLLRDMRAEAAAQVLRRIAVVHGHGARP